MVKMVNPSDLEENSCLEVELKISLLPLETHADDLIRRRLKTWRLVSRRDAAGSNPGRLEYTPKQESRTAYALTRLIPLVCNMLYVAENFFCHETRE